MKKKLFFVFLTAVFLISCSSQTTVEPSELPLQSGTVWVYSYESYELSASDPAQIMRATYELTDAVIETKTSTNFLIAHGKREFKLLNADIGWTSDISNQPIEFWYIVSDNQVFLSHQSPDISNINVHELTLAYEFPLITNATWCLTQGGSKELVGCEHVGKRHVTDQVSFESHAGNFDNCFDLVDYFNGGNIYQKFCNGIGIVFMKFDHVGSRFGFEQTLIDYSPGIQ